jgi:hypothetical protein
VSVAAVSNPTPEDQAVHIHPEAMMSWSVSDTTDPTFDINIGTTTACDEILSAYSTGSSTSYTPTGGFNTTYYWRVDIHEGIDEYIGSVWSFSTGGKATDPVPSNGGTDVVPYGNVSWTGDDSIASYDVYFAEVPDSLTLVDNITDTFISKDVPAKSIGVDILGSNTTYQWRIDTRDSGGSLILSGDLWTFTVEDYNCEDLIQLGIKAAGDMNNDCQVSMPDLLLLAEQWLLEYIPN